MSVVWTHLRVVESTLDGMIQGIKDQSLGDLEDRHSLELLWRVEGEGHRGDL